MIDIERQELVGIPCITLRDRRVEDAPVLIHYHGWTGNKGAIETPDKSLVQLASAGFLVVAPDCYEHGERMTEAWFRAQFNGWAFICEAMDKTRQEAGALFEAVMTLPYAFRAQPASNRRIHGWRDCANGLRRKPRFRIVDFRCRPLQLLPGR